MFDQLLELVRGFEVQLPIAILDIALTAVLIYGLFSLIRGTRAVRLVIGVTVLYAIYIAAQTLGLQLLSQIMQAGAVVGLAGARGRLPARAAPCAGTHRPGWFPGLATGTGGAKDGGARGDHGRSGGGHHVGRQDRRADRARTADRAAGRRRNRRDDRSRPDSRPADHHLHAARAAPRWRRDRARRPHRRGRLRRCLSRRRPSTASGSARVTVPPSASPRAPTHWPW